jgi:hypothetical protein
MHMSYTEAIENTGIRADLLLGYIFEKQLGIASGSSVLNVKGDLIIDESF